MYSESELKSDIAQVVEYFQDKLRKLKVGKVSVETFAELQVEAYGASNDLKGLANITVENNGSSAVIQPWDKSLVKDVLKAITEAEMGFTPIDDGDKVRINVPAVTEETRDELVKSVKLMLEDAKVSIRQARHKYMEQVDKQDGVSEDDQEVARKQIQKQVDSANDQLDRIAGEKEKEVKTV